MPRRIVTMDPECMILAVVDAINRFCRETLVKGGHLATEVLQRDDVGAAKLRIAREIAEAWSEVEVNDPEGG